MSILKLSKNDIIRNEDKEDKIKLKRSDLSYDSAMVSGWEQANRQSLDVLNDYNNRINKSEWLDEEDRKKYRSALDTYIETANYLRGINKTFGEGYSDEDEQKWNDSIASMNEAYDSTEKYYSQWIDEKDYKGQRDGWFQKSNLFDDGYQFGDITKTVGATITDAAQHVGAGIVGMGEAALDALMTIAPYIAQGQYYANGGGYNIQASQAFDQSIETSKKGVSEFVAKDLYDEEAVADFIVSGLLPVEAFTDINPETDSVFGEKTDSLGQSAGQLVGTAGLQAVGVPWWLTTGVTSLGGESQNALNQGATLDEAALSGLVSAGAEILTEKISGGISFGGKTLDDVLPSLTANISNKVVRKLADLGIDMVGEGGEEVLSGVMGAIGQKLTYASDKEISELFSSEDALDSFIGGAVLGFGGSVVGNVGEKIASNKQAKNIYGDNIQDLLIESAEIGGENSALVDKLTDKYGKKGTLSGYDINRLVEANESALVSQDKGKMKSAVEERLTELGEGGDVSKLADVIVKAQSGEKLTSSERNILVNSKYGRRVSTELNPQSIESGEYSSKWAEGIGTERINVEAYNRAVETYAEASEGDPVTENTPIKENATEAKFKVSENAKITIERDGKAVDVKPQKIASIESDEMTIELESGEVVDVDEVNFEGSDIGLVYQAARDMASRVGGFNIDTANVFVKGFNPGAGLTAAEYVHGFSDAYRFGKLGYPISELESGVYTSKLTNEQRTTAYHFGKAFGNEKVAMKQEALSKKESTTKKKGKVYFDGKKYGKSLNERQRASLKGLNVVAESLGIDIHIFESDVVDGKRQGANGWYDPSDKSIHLDLYAGAKGDSLMLFTAAHELTHHIREVAPAKFKVFADALLEEYTKHGKSVEELIQNKMVFLKEKGRITPDMTEDQAYDLAYEEVVADSCEAMLVDSNAFEELSRKLKAKDESLWKKIMSFLENLVARIKAAYKGLSPDSAEANYVRDMMTSAERLQKLWVDALLEASEVSTEQTLGESGIIVNSKTDSASLMSVRDLLTDADRKKVAKALAERFGVTQTEAMDWLKAETSLASLILNPKYSQYLDYTADANEEAIKSNSDYPQGTVDFSNICKKRRDFTEVMNRVLRNYPDHVFTATDLAKIRTIMEEEGMEVACAICYVEDRRQLDGPVAQDFIDSLALYREGSKTRPDGKPFNSNQLKAFKLIEGDTYTPSIYELISLKGRNELKAKNPAMEEAWVKFNNARGMQSVRLLLNDAEYKRQILKYNKNTVKSKNNNGGLRIYSFSDMEMFHLIDIIQVITDSAAVGLSIQGYTKVNEYAKAVKDTGEKLNRSLIPKGDLGYHMENGEVILDFDTVEGIDINHPDFFDSTDNPNVGNIVIGINPTQIKAAMKSKFIDYIIPFHTGQSKEVLGEKGIAEWINYKDSQTEKDLATGKTSKHQINIYTEVIQAAEQEGKPIKNKVDFVNKFLAVCKENNLIPRFSEFLNMDENGDYVYTEGYHKFLVDFKTFDTNTGEYLPQMPVKPIFDNEYLTGLLKDYVKSQKVKDADFAEKSPKVLKRITKEIVKADNSDIRYSDRTSYAPTFYSHMGKVIDDIKIEKMGAAGVVSYLKGKGVKDEEIKWSGIEAFLEGKKSVTKAELQEFVAGSQLQIEEEMPGINNEAYTLLDNMWKKYFGSPLEDTFDEQFDISLTEDTMKDVLSNLSREGYDMPSEAEQDRMVRLAELIGQPTRWDDYKLDGGSNYRELIFKMPHSFYSNGAMRTHWGEDAEGILAHARIQDFVVNGRKMLFVEELQSDWHNEGHQKGYRDSHNKEVAQLASDKKAIDKTLRTLEDDMCNYLETDAASALVEAFSHFYDIEFVDVAINRMVSVGADSLRRISLSFSEAILNSEAFQKYQEYVEKRDNLIDEADKIYDKIKDRIPDAPFHNTYHEYVLKRLLRMAAEEGYDSIGWTTADMQSDRWSDEYAEGYRIEYDQDIPKFLRKYGKKWGATVDKKALPHLKTRMTLYDVNRDLRYDSLKEWQEDVKEWLKDGGFSAREANATKFIREGEYLVAYDYNGNESDRAKVTVIDNQVWSMDITDSMKDSVLYEGQPLYSDRNTASFKGKAFWSGSVSLLDGVIEEVHTIEEAEDADFHHSMYFSQAQVEKMANEENAFFFVENGEVHGDWRVSVPDDIIERIKEQIEVSPSVAEAREFSDADIKYSIREEEPPKKTIEGYKVFVVKNGKLYPPMVANPNAEDTPVGVWLNADVGTRAPDSKTGRMQVKAGGKGTQGGSGSLAFRPGWHLGETPLATQFDRLNPETGVKELFPENFVWALCDIAADHDYQEEAMSYGYTKNGKFQHSLAGLPKLPTDGYYKYRTNPNPDTVPWLITGAMKVKKLLSDAEVNAILEENGLAPKQRVGGEKTLADLGLSEYEGKVFSDRNPDSYSNRSLLANALESAVQNDIEREKLKQYKQKIDLINAEEQKLHDLREQIKELSFKKGARDTEAIKKLQFEANQTANRINTYDRQLLNLESTKALKGVLEREKALTRKKAEQRGKEALDRYREKAAETQRELLTRYQESRKKATEGRNKTAMRHKIKDIVSELNTLLLNPTAKKHIKEELRKEVAEALSAINMDTVGADERVAKYNYLIAKENDPDVIAELTKTRDNIQLQGESLKEKLNNLQSAYEKIKNTDDIELNLAYQEVIHNSIKAVSEKVGNTSIRNMTLEQLEMVYDLFKMIRHTIRDANKSFKTKKGETIMQMAEAVNDQVRTVGGQPYKRNAISAEIQRMGWTFLKPYVAFRTIGSITLTNMYKELRNGEDTFYTDVKEAQAFIEDQYKKHGYKSWDMKKTKSFTAKSGKSFDLTLEQMMTLYAYSKREQAHKHIIEGGIVFEDALLVEKNKLGIPIKYEVTTKDAFNLSEETFKEIANSLTVEQKAFVDEMQAYLSDNMGAKGNEVSMELLGVKLFKEKFYLPIKSSQYYRNFSAEEAGEVKLKSPAFSKETVKHANNPIVLHSFTDLWAEHINDMSMYHSFVLALEDFTRVYNYKTKTDAKVETMDTKATLETAYPGVTNYISKFLKDMNGGVRGETVGWAEKLTSLSKKGAVLGSASVTIQQPSAVMRAMAYISPKHFVTTTHKSINLAKHKQDFEELKKYAPIAGIKEMGRFDVGMGQATVDWIKSNKTVMDKAEDIISLPPAFMDEVTWISIWNAVKRETLSKHKNLSPKSEEFLKIAGERFTDVVSLSQVYDSVFSRSDLMRNKSWIAKSLTAFMAEPSTTLNMIWDSWVQGKRTGSAKGFVKTTASVGSSIVAATVFNAALKSIIMAMRDDDEDESYAEKYLEHFVGDLKDSLNPLGLIPFVKDILSIFNGYDVERMDMALFSDLKKAIDAFDSDSKTLYDKWSGLIGAISAFFGVPVKNVERDVRGFINTHFGKTEDTTEAGMINAIVEGWTGKDISKGNQLYDAMIKGDKAQVKRIEGRFKDQSDIDAAIRKALRENDPRINEAAQAFLKGDVTTYNKLRDEIVAEGIFSWKLVTDALKAEYNYLKNKANEGK